MWAALRSELVKLRQPGPAFAVAAMGAFMLITMLMTVDGAGNAVEDRGPADVILPRSALERPDGLALALGNSVTFVGITALTLVAMNAGGEYAFGTIRNLLVRQPRRRTLLAGKTVALLGFVAVSVASVSAVGVTAAFAMAPGNHVDTAAWTTAVGVGNALVGVANLVIASMGWAALGLLLGIVLRSAAPAIGVGIAYALPVEVLLVEWLPGDGRWLPGQVLQALAHNGTTTMTHGTALVGSAAWILICAAIAIAAFQRRDITT